MRVLLKIGGTLLDHPESRLRLAREIGAVFSSGVELAVVHGGGKQMTRFLNERGVQSRFVNGLRVTTPEVLDAVVKVVAGSVNKDLVTAFLSVGVPATGITGIDANLVTAQQLDPSLGQVGKPVSADARVLETLVAARFLPVVACVAGDRAGNIYNVNADQMAVACAQAFRADRLWFLTDVEGVRGRSSVTEAELDAAECDALIREGIASGGMEAKLRSANAALAGGVCEVVIASGSAPDVVGRLLAGHAIGTRVVPARVEVPR